MATAWWFGCGWCGECVELLGYPLVAVVACVLVDGGGACGGVSYAVLEFGGGGAGLGGEGGAGVA